jgi:tetratricopeptide (TPR) repeat protein
MLSRVRDRPAQLLAAFAVLAVAQSSAAGQGVPALPEVAIDRFPASGRVAVSRAYGQAVARPTDAAAVGALGRVLHAWEQWEGAHQSYSRARALAPKAFEWPYLDAVVLQRLARHDEAVARLELALALSPEYLPARVRLAEAQLEAGDLEKSQRGFQALVVEPQAEPAARMGLGRIAAAQGRHAEAVTQFERAVALFPELGAGYYALARSYRSLGRPTDAERALEQHTRYGARWPRIDDAVLSSVTGLRDDPRALLQRGIALLEAGDFEGAIAAHEAALADDSSLVQAHATLINLYGRTGNWSKAEEHYRAAVMLGLDLADAHYDYGVILGLQEKWEPAEEAYRRAIAVNPLHTQARNNLGQILERRREFEAAAAEYRSAVDAQPTFRLARFNLGRMLLVLGRTPDAIAEFEKLQQPRDAETPRYLFGLATAHVRAGHKDEGLKWANEAKQLALAFKQHELAAAIDREIAKLSGGGA